MSNFRMLVLNSRRCPANITFPSFDKPGCNHRFLKTNILLPGLKTHINWLTSAAAPQGSTISLPHRPTAKGQTIHVTKDIQVLASANNSSSFSSTRSNGGDMMLPGRGGEHSFLAVVNMCRTYTSPFCCICPYKHKLKWQPQLWKAIRVWRTNHGVSYVNNSSLIRQ